MSIEGRLRDLGLTEVLQLMAVGRRSGTLHCEAPLLGRQVRIGFLDGMIANASIRDSVIRGLDDIEPNHADGSGTQPVGQAGQAERVSEVVQEALRWKEGAFRFLPNELPDAESPVRLAVEPILMDGAHQAAVWTRIDARVPHVRVVPTFADIEPRQLPLLKLTPTQWEILTHVDGQRDLIGLAETMRRDSTEIAELVHDLVVAGLLVLREAPTASRRYPTPPVNPAWSQTHDLWIPDQPDIPDEWAQDGSDEADDDLVFDPVDLVMPAAGDRVSSGQFGLRPHVAQPLPEQSLRGGVEVDASGRDDGLSLQRLGNECARVGNLSMAVTQWTRALAAGIPVAEAMRVREMTELATRLNSLLHR